MKLYRKINFFYNGNYLFSTKQSKTCREAKKKYLYLIKLKEAKFEKIGILNIAILRDPKKLKARFTREC